jgi:hypothetical protein
MKKLETIDEAIAKIKQGTNENSSVEERSAIVSDINAATEQELQKTLNAQIATANAEHQAALQAAQQKAQDTQTFITSADIIASAIKTSANNEIIDLDAVNASIAKLNAAGFDTADVNTVQTLFSAEVCGIKDMGIDSVYKLNTALSDMSKVNYQLQRQEATSALCENYEIISCANDTDEYIAFAAASLSEVKKTAATFNVSEADILADAEKLESSDDAKTNGAALRNMQSIVDAYTTTSASQTIAANIATIDNAVNTLKSNTELTADEIFALTLGEHGISTQCKFDAKAKYLMCDADTDKIFQSLVSLKAPKDRQITSAEVDSFRKIDLSTARLKAAGLSDETCEKVQKLTQDLLSTFTSMALRPDASDPKAAYYPTSAKEQENDMSTFAISVYSEMISASTKKLSMS